MTQKWREMVQIHTQDPQILAQDAQMAKIQAHNQMTQKWRDMVQIHAQDPQMAQIQAQDLPNGRKRARNGPNSGPGRSNGPRIGKKWLKSKPRSSLMAQIQAHDHPSWLI